MGRIYDPGDPNEEFKPEDTIAVKLRAKARDSRSTRETLGNTSGVGGASIVLWLAGLAGVDMPAETAVVVGGILSTVLSSLIRKYLSK